MAGVCAKKEKRGDSQKGRESKARKIQEGSEWTKLRAIRIRGRRER
jgi:hypothetical protein